MHLFTVILLLAIASTDATKKGFTYTDPPNYPLNPLTPSEQAKSVQIVSSTKEYNISTTQFDRIELLQPTKSFVKGWKSGDSLSRKSRVTTYDSYLDKYYQYTVNLDNLSHSVTTIQGARPPWTNTDNNNIVDLVLDNEKYRHALAERGINSSQFDNGQVQPYTLIDGRLNSPASTINMPNLDPLHGIRPRSWWGTTLLLDAPLDDSTPLANYYVYPVPGVVFWADANNQTISKIVNSAEKAPMPSEPGLMNINYPPNVYTSNYRKMQNPIVMAQPDGPSFKFGGKSGNNMNEITWHKWSLMFDVHEVTGLKLFNIKYNDKKTSNGPDNWRTIAYQHGFHETITAYGSDQYPDRNMNYLDFGEYPYKFFACPLDVDSHGLPPYTVFLNSTFIDETGSGFDIPHTVGIYEVPDGMLWSHYDFWTGVNQGRTHIKMKMSFCTCIGNYDYLLTYEFGMDGSIVTTAVPSGFDEMAAGTKDILTAQLIHKGIIGANHQHFFGVRTDWELDGKLNSVYQADKVPTPDIGNAAWTVKKSLIEKTGDSGRMENMDTGRTWLVVNEETIDSLGHKPGYGIMIDSPASRLASDPARISTRTDPMLTHNIFVTKYREDQDYFISTYPVEKAGVDGVTPSQYNEALFKTDIVTWVTIGFAHSPIPENFPVLPGSMKLSMRFDPNNFFTQNPAMDADIDVVVGEPHGKNKPCKHKENIMRKRMQQRMNKH